MNRITKKRFKHRKDLICIRTKELTMNIQGHIISKKLRLRIRRNSTRTRPMLSILIYGRETKQPRPFDRLFICYAAGYCILLLVLFALAQRFFLNGALHPLHRREGYTLRRFATGPRQLSLGRTAETSLY